MTLNKILRLLKYLIFFVIGLILVVALGLHFYYQSIYKESPMPVATAAKPALKGSVVLTDKPVLLPVPQKLEWQTGSFTLSKTIDFDAPKEDVELIKKSVQNRRNLAGAKLTGGYDGQ